MIVLLRAWLPKRSQQREFQFFPPVLPEVVHRLPKSLHILHLVDILVLALDESHYPSFTFGDIHALAAFLLQFDEGSGQELLSEDCLAVKLELVLVPLQEDMVHLSQLVIILAGEVEMGRQADVVRSDLRVWLCLSHLPSDILDFGHRDVVLIQRWCLVLIVLQVDH